MAFVLLLCASNPALAGGAKASDPAKDYLLHLPGISGYHWLDRQMLTGLRDGGFSGDVDVRNWPGDEPGLAALFARKRNLKQAEVVADAIVAHARAHPAGRIVLTAHSGGAGIAVWALETLPDDVKVDMVLMLAPALSPQYDLTTALGHVRGKVYAFTSPLDLVLGPGTSTFGTIDGVRCDAAGRCGFVVPERADGKAYEKLVQVPYDAKWMREGNLGDHIGPMGRQFSRNVLAPLVVGGGSAPLKVVSAAKGQGSSSVSRRNEGAGASRKTEHRAASTSAPHGASTTTPAP